jgi:hypothetical protein
MWCQDNDSNFVKLAAGHSGHTTTVACHYVPLAKTAITNLQDPVTRVASHL